MSRLLTLLPRFQPPPTRRLKRNRNRNRPMRFPGLPIRLPRIRKASPSLPPRYPLPPQPMQRHKRQTPQLKQGQQRKLPSRWNVANWPSKQPKRRKPLRKQPLPSKHASSASSEPGKLRPRLLKHKRRIPHPNIHNAASLLADSLLSLIIREPHNARESKAMSRSRWILMRADALLVPESPDPPETGI